MLNFMPRHQCIFGRLHTGFNINRNSTILHTFPHPRPIHRQRRFCNTRNTTLHLPKPVPVPTLPRLRHYSTDTTIDQCWQGYPPSFQLHRHCPPNPIHPRIHCRQPRRPQYQIERQVNYKKLNLCLPLSTLHQTNNSP